MYEENPACEKPVDGNVRIWSCLDFTKFVALLDKEALSTLGWEIAETIDIYYMRPTLGFFNYPMTS